MKRERFYFLSLLLGTALLFGGCALGTPIPPPANTPAVPEAPANPGFDAAESPEVAPAFDIVHAQVTKEDSFLVFQLLVQKDAGSIIPAETGQLAGAAVESYVWPTSLDSSSVGFDAEQGILALAVTAHPDFDDTPLVDEDGDGDKSNDGRHWHSHWVVLVKDETCAGGLKVQDIPEGEQPTLPATWPELPLLIDSPNFDLDLTNSRISVHVPYEPFANQPFNYDGVAAGLQVNANLHTPLLCVSNVHDIASGDLSLPGAME
ncbi:MAG: hypothetical protein WBO46_01450 [Caldilineaceae bacterium]